jgi:sugar lactone lactonase YvrE
VGDRTVNRLNAAGNITTILSNLSEPEGLAFLPDGSLVVAEQGRNRLLRVDLSAQAGTQNFVPRLFLQLVNNTNHPGVDGIIFDTRSQTLIVPDSPNGALLRVSADGKILETIARGFARPTGADVEPDGSILVADENGGAIRRVPPGGGAPEVVARMPLPDDVITDGNGNIYINSLGDNAIHHVDARTGADRIITRALSNPQGIIFDVDGNLIATDPGHHRIVKIVIH